MIGSQTPRVRVVPDTIALTYGDDAADLCAHYWFAPDEFQREALRVWLGRDASHRLAVISAGLAVPRQNGKNGAVEALEFYLLVTDPDAHILHTAHQVKTCKKAFQRLSAIFADKRHPEIRALVRDIRRTNGEEGIYLWHPDHIGDPAYRGATIEYTARSRGSARGFDKISLVVYDEAQELTDEQVEALTFTMGASETDRFILYTGTPPGPNSPGTVFTRFRDNALHSPTPHMAWMEWSVADCPVAGSTFEDVEPLVWQTNPAMGTRLSIDFTREEFAGTSIDGFARERLGWWTPTSTSQAAIPRDLWKKAEIKAIANLYRKKTALAVKFTTDGSAYALAGAKMNAKGEVATELVELGTTAAVARHRPIGRGDALLRCPGSRRTPARLPGPPQALTGDVPPPPGGAPPPRDRRANANFREWRRKNPFSADIGHCFGTGARSDTTRRVLSRRVDARGASGVRGARTRRQRD